MHDFTETYKYKMNTHEPEMLEALFHEHSNEVLRVQFTDGDIYDLTAFHVFCEVDGKYVECWADVVRPIKVLPEKEEWFKNAGMSFQLNEVLEVSNIETGKSLLGA